MSIKKLLITTAFLGVATTPITAFSNTDNEHVKMETSVLADKIKGGWAGQSIGVSFGSHTEFKYQGTFIQDYYTIPWEKGQVKHLMDTWPDLYDDIYMDLTFVDVMEKQGIDAPTEAFEKAFATAGYSLWHANQAARWNILHGIESPGYWENNPHADDIDWQIEADFTGLMNPGMPNSASETGDRIGHIMCYGDGWYGGVYVGAMYSLAFIYDDVEKIVTEALKTIPQESTFYRCIADVIKGYKQHPDDWKHTWFEIQKNWAEEVGCPEGVLAPLDIDAKINAAYIVLGLLYGEGDFTKTMEISTRAGQDSDCNPSSAGGILGTMYGYSGIPDYWKEGLEGAEDQIFKYTNLSLNQIYAISLKHALEMIKRNGGDVSEETVIISVQKPESVRMEQCFPDMIPEKRVVFYRNDIEKLSLEFEGSGIVVRGECVKRDGGKPDCELKARFYVDGKPAGEALFPTSFHGRRLDIFWKYRLPQGKHNVEIEIVGEKGNALLRSWDYIVYKNTI